MKTTIVINGVGFTLRTNAARSQGEFVDRWIDQVWPHVPADKREALLKEAHSLVLEAAGIEPLESEISEGSEPSGNPEQTEIKQTDYRGPKRKKGGR